MEDYYKEMMWKDQTIVTDVLECSTECVTVGSDGTDWSMWLHAHSKPGTERKRHAPGLLIFQQLTLTSLTL